MHIFKLKNTIGNMCTNFSIRRIKNNKGHILNVVAAVDQILD